MQSRPSKKRSEGKRASVQQGQPTWRLAFYLEGLFYAFEMESIVLKRLKGGLQRLQRRFQTKTSLHPATVYPLLDAWSYVDVIHRLRELLRQVPKLKTRDAAVRSFLDETASADHLGRYVQHMRRQTGTTPGPAGPLWGALSWVDSDGDTGRSVTWRPPARKERVFRHGPVRMIVRNPGFGRSSCWWPTI